jgi:CheY-like chemotaxis protein
MLRQTLMNLLSYALHVARADLAITVSREAKGLLIDISESVSPHPAAEPTTRESQEPDEMSLAAARALIEAQGGYLETDQQAGKWHARIVLPASGQKTVLVIDDNADIVSLLRRYLGGHDVQVVSATDGEQALRLATEIKPQAITLDVMIPNLDGWEILQRLKGSPDTQHIPVIICSVLNQPELAQSMGANDYITKPVNQVELLEVLRRWIGPLRPAA